MSIKVTAQVKRGMIRIALPAILIPCFLAEKNASGATEFTKDGAWKGLDVGAVRSPGTFSVSGTTFRIRGDGVDSLRSEDAFYYVYQSFCGDGEVIAKVTNVEKGAHGASAGIMVRETLNPVSRMAYHYVTLPRQSVYDTRRSQGNPLVFHRVASATSKKRVQWLRLVRQGDLLTAYQSSDGTSWQETGRDTVRMATHIYVGLATSARAATFERVSIQSEGLLPRPSATYQANSKKLIMVDHFLSSELVDTHIADWQKKRPFLDGIAFHNGVTTNPLFVFEDTLWTQRDTKIERMRSIKDQWSEYTDNFLLVLSGLSDGSKVSFFDDARWKKIIANNQLIGQAAKAAGCVGIVFDTEPYAGLGKSPWVYSDSGTHYYPGKSYEEVAQKAQERGEMYINILEESFPEGIRVLIFLGYEIAWTYPRVKNNGNLSASEMSLLAPFLDGMLSGADPGTTLISGNESSYYLDDARKYTENTSEDASYLTGRDLAPTHVSDPALRDKYNQQVQVAMAPYVEQSYDLDTLADYRRKIHQHQVYHSLLTTDQYVWIWMESGIFWGNHAAVDTTGQLMQNGDRIGTYWDDTLSAHGISMAKMAANQQEAIRKFREGERLEYEMVVTDPDRFVWDYGAAHVKNTLVATITQPRHRTVIPEPTRINIEVKVSDSSRVNRVELYVNSVRVDEDLAPPYTFIYDVKQDDYLLFARVFMNGGGEPVHATSNPVLLLGRKDASVE